jgi:myosin heavy subunit
MSAPPDDGLADDDLDTTARLPILSPADIVEAGGPWDLTDELVSVRERIASLEAALADTESKLAQLQARYDSLQSHHADLLIHGQAVSRDRDRLAEESLLWLASRQQLQDQLEQQRQQGETLQAEVLTAQQQFAEQHASAAALARSMAQALHEKDDLQRSLLAREQRIAALESDLEDTSAQLASAIANGESLVQSVVTHQQEISERARLTTELQRELSERKAEIDALQEAQAALAQREATLLDSVTRLREELGQAQLQLQERDERALEQARELDGIHSTNQELTEQIRHRDQTVAVQAERIANLSAAFERLQDELAAKHVEQGASARQIEALQAELHQHVEAMHAIRRDIHQVALQTRRNEGETLLRTLTREDAKGVVHLLNKSSISIGRGPDCDIRLRSSSVSRYHAVLRINHDAVILEDRNSTNGCYVNGRRVTRQLLKDGDMLRVGAVPLRFGSRNEQD